MDCGSGSKTSNIAQNILIARAYAATYVSNKRLFKWVGMAA